MILFPKAKINIGLNITGKRKDGYHNLQTVFYPAGLCDALEFIVPQEKLEVDELKTSGIAMDCRAENNLVIKALHKLREYRQIPFLRIHLHKVIPHGAGLGGGSSDAAAFIKGLNRFFNLQLSADTMKDIALSIGSDCPFFIDGIPVYAEGRGEITSPVRPLPDGYWLVIVKPPVDVSTAEAYSECRPEIPEDNLSLRYLMDISLWKENIINDFEKTVFRKHPEVGRIKEELYETGALYSSMSGSGSAVYGIFSHKPDLPQDLKTFTVYSGKL